MESFHPGVKSIVFALLCAFLTTKNGRQLGARIIHKHIKSSILFWLPIKTRCKIVEKIMSAPIPKGRALMSQATKPWGEQWDYITPVKKSGLKGHWIVSPEQEVTGKLNEIEATAKKSDLTIYYIHGGGFRFGDSIMYMDSFMHIINHLKKTKGLNVRIFSIEYTRMPEVKYENTKQDCLDGYRYLVKALHVPANKIIFAGDSAGGNLVASCLQTIRDQPELGFDLPLGNVMISPWISIERNANIQANSKRYVDCITYSMLNTHHYDYFTTKDMKDPSISPLFGSFVGFCPTLVTFGGTEVFQHDIQQLIQKLKQDNVNTTVITRFNAPHIWLISSFLSPTRKMWEEDCSKLADWCSQLLVG